MNLVARIHNPRNRECGCSPECWCQTTALGRAFRWWFPARWFGIQHVSRYSALEKRHLAGALTRVARVVGVEPIFVVADVPRSVANYERLGFSTSHHDESYAFAHRNELTIHLAGAAGNANEAGRGSIYMHVDDADRLADEWRKAGVEFVEPQDFDYGKREGSHTDPDGNLIRFGSPLRR